MWLKYSYIKLKLLIIFHINNILSYTDYNNMQKMLFNLNKISHSNINSWYIKLICHKSYTLIVHRQYLMVYSYSYMPYIMVYSYMPYILILYIVIIIQKIR